MLLPLGVHVYTAVCIHTPAEPTYSGGKASNIENQRKYSGSIDAGSDTSNTLKVLNKVIKEISH